MKPVFGKVITKQGTVCVRPALQDRARISSPIGVVFTRAEAARLIKVLQRFIDSPPAPPLDDSVYVVRRKAP